MLATLVDGQGDLTSTIDRAAFSAVHKLRIRGYRDLCGRRLLLFRSPSEG